MQPLSEIEVDGRPITFDHGMLLLHQMTGDIIGHWHIVLLRVPPADMLCVGADPEADCAVVAETDRGERLVGWAHPRPFKTAPDCLRLVGISPLEWGES
jgi:hypothetical protein